MENKLRYANERLLIKDDSRDERDRNLIFVYCPPKVGSTSLVSSLRLFSHEKYNVLHLHSEEILKTLYDIDVTINDIIEYNNSLGKNIYVIDIYRFPIEHKISIFFEKLEKFHFNNSVENIEKYPIEKIIKRFNSLFPYLGEKNDYFRNEYSITYPETFDFEKKYVVVKKENIQYIKVRLCDSLYDWERIMKEILGVEIKIMRDYETSEKPIKNVFKKFMSNYEIPENLLESIKEESSFFYYNTKEECIDYLNLWKNRRTGVSMPYTKEEYMFYSRISRENQYMNEIQSDHYIDNGCICNKCVKKREILREKVKEGESIKTRVKHEKTIIAKRNYTLVLYKKKRLANSNIKLNVFRPNSFIQR